jgi:hypothetical protein
MQVAVLDLSDDWVLLGAPLAPNVNHRGTPITAAFSARASLAPGAPWPLFLRTLERRGKAHISVAAQLLSQAQDAGHFVGEFVALAAGGRNMSSQGVGDA